MGNRKQKNKKVVEGRRGKQREGREHECGDFQAILKMIAKTQYSVNLNIKTNDQLKRSCGIE